MPEENHDAGEMEKSQIIFRVVFITHDQPAEVVEPGEQSLHLPSTLKAAQRSSILSLPLRPTTRSMWRDHFGPELIEYFCVEAVAVVSLIANQSFGNIGDESPLQSLRDQFHFSRASTFCADGQRKAVAVCNCHDLAALSALGLSHAEPPFFAGTKVPSMKHSRRSRPPRSFRSCATAKRTASSTLERTQFWNRRCIVCYAPYRLGRSFQGAPVRKIHRIPFKVVRGSVQGRPRPSARTRSGGKMVSTTCHCSSVKSISPHSTLTLKVQELIYEMASSTLHLGIAHKRVPHLLNMCRHLLLRRYRIRGDLKQVRELLRHLLIGRRALSCSHPRLHSLQPLIPIPRHILHLTIYRLVQCDPRNSIQHDHRDRQPPA